MTIPVFPPLFTGRDAAGADPFLTACQTAANGCDAGLVLYELAPDILRAALVFAPDVVLSQAVAMLHICGVGFQNALGALAPPEVGVNLGWDGTVYVNGGRCGALRAQASSITPGAVPDWLVIGLTLQLWPRSEDMGLTPDETALYAEGCADVDAVALLEAWVRHTLVGINTWEDGGTARLHREWEGIAWDIGETVTFNGTTGIFLGVDENIGALLKTDAETLLIPLTTQLTRPS